MSDVNANIRIGVDSTQAISSLRSLQNQISTFNKSIVASNAQALAAQSSALSGLTAQIGATKQFSTSIVNVESSVSRLGKAIDKNKLSLGEYFRYGTASTKNFGRVFGREHTQIMDLASERVKRLQTQYIALSSAQNGMTKAMAIRPLNLFNADAAISVQRQQIFNKLLRDGSTSLINFGKNTQWAGRQLMVGFTVPLTIFGGIAGQIFMDLERQVVNFRRVYGDAMTPSGETDQMIEEIKGVAKEFTKYGIAVKDTVGLASDIAATGAQGEDLVAATAQSTRLATLGMIEMNQAMDATISLQTAFKLSNEELANSVNFLNAVENQTVLSLDDVTVAIPKVAPIIKGLGGDVQDLAFFLTAMREGGVNAAEGANALKSGLASLINPTKGAREQLEKVGINIDSIIKTNKGDIRATVQEFGNALMTLDKFSRQQTLAKVFGKYQFARLGALFENINRDGSQAQRVLDLTGQSIEELAGLADKELGAIEESIGMKFTGAVERLKLALAPIGEVFLRIATPIIDFATKILEKFNELSPGVKQFISVIVAGVGVVVPTVIMLIGLFGNFIGQAIKGFAVFNSLFNRLRGGGKDLAHMAGEQLDAAAAAASLEGKTESLTSALNVQRSAVNQLARAYGGYVKAANAAATGLPQGFGKAPRRMATGGMVGGSGSRDTEPALLTPGEFVINADSSKKFAPILSAINEDRVGKYARGRTSETRGQVRSFSFGDLGSVELSVFSQESFRSIQEMADTLSGATEQVRIEFMEILRGLETTQNVTKGIIQNLEQVKQSQFSEIKSFAGERRASFPGSETPEAQLSRQTGMSQAQIDAELQTARVSAQGAVDAVELAKTEYVNAFRQLGVDAESISVEANLARAHTQNVDKSQGLAAWHANFWQMQSQAENQFLETGIRQSQRNQDFLMQFMGENEEAQALMNRMTSGISLTEQEYEQLNVALSRMLAAVKSNPMLLTQGEGVSSSFLTQAIGAQGAYAARSEAGLSYSSPRSVEGMAQESLTALRTVNRSASPAETYAREGDYVAQGYAEGITRSANIPVKAANQMAQKVAKATRSASRPQGPAGMSQSELQAQINEERRAQRRVRGAVVRPGTLSPLALRPDEESSRVANIANAQEMAMREEVNRSHELAIVENEKLTRQTSETSKEMSKTKGYAKKFGGALMNGSAKLTGAMFAMDGIVFAASMMNNSVGEFAQKIMPAVFAVQGFSMMLPMLTSALPMLANPMVATALAVAALGIGIWKVNDIANGIVQKGGRLVEAMTGTTKTMEGIAEYFGRQTVTQQLATLQASRAAGRNVATEEVSQAQEFIQSDTGRQLIQDYQFIKENLGSGKAAQGFANQIKRAILSGALPPEMGVAIAAAASAELKDKNLAAQVSGEIKEYIGLDGEKITSPEGRLRVYASIFADTANIQRAAAEAGEIWAKEWWGGQVAMILTGRGTSDIVAQQLGTAVVASQQMIQEQLAANELAYQKGEISARKFLQINNEILKSAELQGATWEGVKQRFELAYPDMADQTDIILQTVVNPFLDTLRVGLGEAAADGIISGLENVVAYGNAETGLKVNLFDAEEVRVGLEGFRSQIQTLKDQMDGASESEKAILQSQITRLENAATRLQNMQRGAMNIAIAVQSGQLSPEALSKLFEGRPEKSVTLMLGAVPDELSIQFLNLVDQLGGEGNVIDVGMNFIMSGNMEDLQRLLLATTNIGQTTIDPNKIINEDTMKTINATSDALNRYQRDIDGLNKKEIKTKTVNFLVNGYGIAKERVDWFLSLDPVQQRTFLTVYETVIAQPTMAQNITPGSSAAGGMGNVNYAEMFATAGKTINENIKEETDNITDKNKGGGDATKSWLQQLIDDTQANLALFPGMLNKLKGMGIPEQIIEMIGGGEEGLKKAKELLGASREKLNKLIADFNKNTINEIIKSTKQATEKAQQKNMATDILISQGISREDADAIASDSENALAIITAAGDKSGKSIKKLVDAFKELQSVPEFVDPIKNKLEEINNIYKAQMLPLQQKIDKQQEIVNSIQEEIDELQKLSGYDQDRIRDLERQKEMIQRQIEEYERANELDQRRIDTLQRQDELRNRESDALSHELDVLSDMEQKIRDAYQERIDALTTVANLNDDILERQKDQLGVSQALAEGDIYAATAAAQQMRQNQIKSAQQLSIDALNQARDNSIAGLVTSGGLTRDQAEERIRQIKEQSYQTSLLVRDIEDEIFNRNQLMIPLKDQQLNIDRQIRDISDIIYNRESQIINIQRKRLDPQTQILKNITDQASELKKNLDIQSGILDGADLLNSMTDEQITAAGLLGSQWHEVAKQIQAAQVLASNKKASLIIPDPKNFEGKPKKYAAALEKYNADVARIDAEAQVSVDAAIATGQAAMNKNMGGKIMKYARGNIVGSGGMDSVPAMLTPGEYVIRKAMVDKYGTPMFDKINQGSFSMPSFNTGEKLTTSISGTSGPSTNVVAPMYNNYSVNVSVSNSGASADEIANKTLMKIKQLQNTQIRSGRGY